MLKMSKINLLALSYFDKTAEYNYSRSNCFSFLDIP